MTIKWWSGDQQGEQALVGYADLRCPTDALRG